MRISKAQTIAALLFGAILGVSAPALADWQSEISDYDTSRLQRLDESRRAGMAEAEAGARPSDLAAIRGVVGPKGSSADARAFLGTWRCRTMKLGGVTPAVVYGWFTCRFRETRNGIYFEKLTGSQRFSGYADPYQGHLIFLGAMTVGNEPRKPYSGSAVGAGPQTTSSDMVGVVTSISPGHARIEFPYPILESTFDVVELSR